jgi:hypothetical protein
VQVIPIQPHDLRADRHDPATGLRPRPVVVDPRHDRQLPLRRGDVLMPQPQRLTDPDARVPQQREQQPVPQMLADIQNRCISPAVTTRGSFFGTRSLIVRFA